MNQVEWAKVSERWKLAGSGGTQTAKPLLERIEKKSKQFHQDRWSAVAGLLVDTPSLTVIYGTYTPENRTERKRE